MKANRKADLQRKLTLRVVPTPPAGLAERIKSDIPKHLPTATELDRRRLNSAVAFNMRVAASVLLLIGSLFFALHLLNRAYVQEDARMASFDKALKSNSAPSRDVSPLPKPQRSEPQVVTSTEQPPKVVAPPAPARPLIAKQQQTERGRVQIADANNGPADHGEAGRRENLARDERKDTDRQKAKDRKTNAETDAEKTKGANELKALGYLDKTQVAGSEGTKLSGFDRGRTTTVAGGAAPAAPPVSQVRAQPVMPAPPPMPVPPPASAAAAPVPVPAPAGQPASVAESVTVQAEAPQLVPSEKRVAAEEKDATRKAAKKESWKVDGVNTTDQAAAAPGRAFGYALTGRSLEPAPLVQRFTAPESRPRHGLQVEASAAPAPLDATKNVLRVSIDTALGSSEAGTPRTAVASDVQWEVAFDPANVTMHRAVTGEPKYEPALTEGVSVTALYELALKPALPPAAHVATVSLHYRSLPDGQEQTITREIYVRDIAASWDAAPARTKRAALAAAFAEAHARGADTTAIVAKARAMGFEALVTLARSSS